MSPSLYVCAKPDCTFPVTGTCLDSIANPTEKCPNIQYIGDEKNTDADKQVTENMRHRATSARIFPSGLEMGFQEIASLMCARYTRIVGILGQTDAGKTCLFTSLYLRLSTRRVDPRFRFAGSRTLQGFEHRIRHLRDWTKNGVPDQIVDRTSLGNPRFPAFLHLEIQEEDATRHDLLLPDLPGEWTTQLLSDATTAKRFQFLQRSDIVLFALEAPLFASRRTRNNAITDARQLITRIADNVCVPNSIPLVFVVTKCDRTNGEAPVEVGQVVTEASRLGYNASVVPVAAFPGKDSQIAPGFGMDGLLNLMTLPEKVIDSDNCRGAIHAKRSYLSV